MPEFGLRSIRNLAPGDGYRVASETEDAKPAHPLDGEEARKVHRRLLGWFYLERDKQSANRLDMAMDCDFYDSIQWVPEDAEALRNRGQMPLVYNEIAPAVDWIIGTERRTKVDWRVLPRAEDDVESADTKTKVLKYVSDVNRVQFTRSKAFADAVKAGVGWVDDGARDDPTQDILYSRYEDWRNVLWDSSSYELDLSDARYLFRWRWVDEDIAMSMFPQRAEAIRRAMEDAANPNNWDWDETEDSWYLGENIEKTGRLNGIGSAAMVDAQRKRVRLIEAQYRMPVSCKIVEDGPMRGAFFDERDLAMSVALACSGSSIVEKVVMRTHVAVFTEGDMIAMNRSIYRHNRFSLTPIWCYRRSRDRLPYGIIRRVRDIQQDMNKRASKALFMLNTNQIIADEGAVADPVRARDEADRPDGYIEKKANKEFTLRRDTDAATGQIQMMTLAAQSIQKSVGVNNENLGRQTNAVSGAAIEARQNQGSVGTTEPFDNLRLAVQIQGEKQLALVEQFYTEEKVVRLTGARGALEWVKVNVPEIQPDGSVRILNDITASMADFVVSDADYAGTLRQVMFDNLNALVQKLPPEVGLRLFTLAMEFSDLPNKDDIAAEIRRMTGDRDPNKPMSPEEAQQAEEQMREQSEAMRIQRETAMLALEEQRAKVRELNAKAAEIEARAGAQGVPPEIEQALAQVQRNASDQIQAMSDQLRKAQADVANKTMAIKQDADTKMEIARIDAASRERVAEIQAANDKRLMMLEQKLEEIAQAAEEARSLAEERPEAEDEPTEKPAAEPAPQQPITINVQVDAKTGAVKKEIKVEKDAQGNITGASVEEVKRNEG